MAYHPFREGDIEAGSKAWTPGPATSCFGGVTRGKNDGSIETTRALL